jgi:C4-dicarboxylate transporter DctM subunit
VLDGLSIMLLTVPIVAPVVVELGFSPIWFGILFMKMVEIGLITPPVGINVYVVAGMFKELKVESVFRSILPFVLLDLGVVVLLFFNPGIVTWLPNHAG